MKQIVTSLGVIVFVAAIVAGGTGAFFSDTETSTGNNFTAGALDLTIDSVAHINGLVCYEGKWVPETVVVWDDGELVETGDIEEASASYNKANPSNVPQAGDACDSTWELTDLGPSHTFFNYGDLKPGDNGENTISLHVDFNDAYMCAVVSNVEDLDNTQTEPESDVPDADGLASGELDSELTFVIWEDDGDNILEEEENVLVDGSDGENIAGVYELYTPATEAFPGDEVGYLGVYWCYGDVTGVTESNLSCSGEAVSNISQTDSLEADITFYIEQARNNASFECPRAVEPDPSVNVVESDDLAETVEELLAGPTKWLFYNDTNDTIMTLNQFAGTGGVNDIVAGPGLVGAAQMTLDTGVNPRYNIATYKYNDVKLADIDSLTYRMYDGTASAETPFLHFNVDLANNNTWQGRLVQVPTGVVPNTWTTVDALAGMWTKTSGNWPVGVNTAVPFSGATARTWADIIADYPNAETRSTDSFFGIRVGHPGPVGATGYVDWVEFDGEVTDFE